MKADVSQRIVLPDFCAPQTVLLLVLVGMMLSLIMTLASLAEPGEFWTGFATRVLFIQWIVLASAVILCLLRRIMPIRSLSAMAWSILLAVGVVTLAVSLVTIRMHPLDPTGSDAWFVLRNLLIAGLSAMLLARYLVLQHRWKEQVQAEARARLDALQARIRPHFLFNSLNTIASLVHDKPDEAEQATLDLSDLLRTGLRSGARQTLGEELELVRGYLRLESLRLGDRLQVAWSLDESLPLEQELPALLLQPLVENAVVHGIARLPGGGTLTIRGERLARNRLHFEIVNPVPDAADRPADTNRMALDNIRQRLALAYEDGARLRTRRAGNAFHVELVIPL
jgi:two-component system sensor histidine kinase AlgZ